MTEPLRNYSAWQKSIRNFEWLQETVSGAMDVDMMVERKGKFLIIEGKPWYSEGGVLVPYGQHRALYMLSKQPNTLVYLVGEAKNGDLYIAGYHESPRPKFWRGSNQSYWPEDRFTKTTKPGIREMVRRWWEEASGEG